ncbi:beta-lactamase-like protein [Candidatus Koribacter versatilis Ellin345]|uniref:Beta-lactamase-like protein n=2 Tax=Koribacter versatilis (strain Ellin345) TaxID=204669 RepID=Q1INB9_KORVE|nr:MBL fold metallo-hydrolase [Candidatus Koribacter versatilis]ABF41631.1 beta-lactamase-like protein [Candidatus Koribacter versatilis Ellin345]
MRATLTVLGSGTSMGVPTIGCDCAVCSSSDPHDRRLRPSVMVQYDGKLVLIDTTPDFREQALREGIKKIDAIVYTHGHADHILGLDDVRPLSFPRITGGARVPLYANEKTERVLKHVFKYIFDDDYKFGSIAQVEMHRVHHEAIELFGAKFIPVPVIHGETEIYGYRFGSAAYLTDFSSIPDASMEMLRGLDILFLDALRHKPHPTHSTLDNSVSIAEKLKAKHTYFTHISHDLPHEETNRQLPAGIQLAHDGLKLEFEL